MKNKFKYILIFLFIIVVISIFGNLVIHSTSYNNPGGRFVKIEKAIVSFSKLPINSIKFINCYLYDDKNSCAGFGGEEFTYYKHGEKKIGLTIFSKKTDDLEGYILFSRYFKKKRKNIIQLFDIKNNKIIHLWDPDIVKINSLSEIDRNIRNLEVDANRERYLFYHPLLFENGSIITHSGSPLIKIDKCSKLEWQIDEVFHHSINKDSDGNMWIPTRKIPGNYKSLHQLYHDDEITKISPKGKILFQKSVTDILYENNIYQLVTAAYYGDDPIHLNDIEAVTTDSEFWLTGDIFLSIRSLSLVVLYRPSENKVIWHKQGPWRFQHDVDIVNNHTISIFGNDATIGWHESHTNSEIYFFDFTSNNTSKPYSKLFLKHNINSVTDALYRLLKDGDIYVEETNHGRLLRGDANGNLKWEFIWNSLINWSRFINEDEFNNLNFLKENIKC